MGGFIEKLQSLKRGLDKQTGSELIHIKGLKLSESKPLEIKERLKWN